MKRVFPLRKDEVTINRSNTEFLPDYTKKTEIPEYPHPGSFGYIRKNHTHEGVDLYANEGDAVYAMEDGVVTKIIPFTGEIANSPWWNNTYSILVKHHAFSLNYGELIPVENLKDGDIVKAGDIIGHIRTVLLIDKGRPMAMLHLEMYDKDTSEPITEWTLGSEKPKNLMNPTDMLKDIILNG